MPAPQFHAAVFERDGDSCRFLSQEIFDAPLDRLFRLRAIFASRCVKNPLR